MEKNKMLVAAIQNGTVIDHIPSEKTYQVATLLELDQMTNPVTIGYNLDSKKLGKTSVYHLCSLGEVDTVVCDEDISKIYGEKFPKVKFITAK